MQLTNDNSTLCIQVIENANTKNFCHVNSTNWVVVNDYIDTHIHDESERSFYKSWVNSIRWNSKNKQLFLHIKSKKIYYWADGPGPHPKQNRVKYDTGVYHYYITILM